MQIVSTHSAPPDISREISRASRTARAPINEACSPKPSGLRRGRPGAAHDHGADALVGEQLHEQRVRLAAVDDVGGMHPLRQAPDAAFHLHAPVQRPTQLLRILKRMDYKLGLPSNLDRSKCVRHIRGA